MEKTIIVGDYKMTAGYKPVLHLKSNEVIYIRPTSIEVKTKMKEILFDFYIYGIDDVPQKLKNLIIGNNVFNVTMIAYKSLDDYKQYELINCRLLEMINVVSKSSASLCIRVRMKYEGLINEN